MEQLFSTYDSIAPFLTVGLFVVLLVLLVWILVLNSRLSKAVKHYQSLLKDTSTKNLQQVLDDQLQVMQATSDQLADLNQKYDRLTVAVLKSLQQVGVVRFNPFRDMGGDQSFAVALLDGRNNGIVVSSLHSREATRVYAKPIISGESPHTLSEEEAEAIQRARTV